MSPINIGQKIPDLKIITNQGSKQLIDFIGKNIILFFYPKDNTPGCTIEAKSFRDLYPEFQKANTVIFGISRDSLKSHQKFIEKYELPFELISDENETICQLFNVIKTKKMFAKTFLGIERSTFLIDKKGILRKEWRKVKVKDHAKEVLAAL